jgi:ABC-type sugar transport system ATPase subunit
LVVQAQQPEPGAPAEPGAPTPALELRRLAKAFGQVRALSSVSLTAFPGEIHAVVGDNGAGKSTMLKIVSGVLAADSGEIVARGRVVLQHGGVARTREIAVVYQDLAVVECLDVATNMALGGLPTRGRFLLDRRRMDREAKQVITDLGIRIGSVKTSVGLLSGGERQIVAIARAVRLDTPILLLDEPTAALGVRETRHVGEILDGLRSRGKAILCISHDLEFVFNHSDRITVMRLGRTVGTRLTVQTTREEIVGMITGAIASEEASGD